MFKEKIIVKFINLKNALISSQVYKTLKRIFTLRGANHFAPAALSFYLILSLIPCLVLIEVILSLFNKTFDQNLSILSFFFTSEDQLSSLQEIISSLTRGDIFSILFSVFFIFFLASRGITFFTLQVKRMYGINYQEQHFIKRRLFAILLTLLLLIILSFLIVFLVIFASFFTIKNPLISSVFYYFFILINLFIFIEFLYVISTDKSEKFKEVFWGALFSTLGIGIGMLLYYYYLKYVSSSLSYYGPLSILAFLYLMSYFSSFILFFGVEINIIFKENKKKIEP